MVVMRAAYLCHGAAGWGPSCAGRRSPCPPRWRTHRVSPFSPRKTLAWWCDTDTHCHKHNDTHSQTQPITGGLASVLTPPSHTETGEPGGRLSSDLGGRGSFESIRYSWLTLIDYFSLVSVPLMGSLPPCCSPRARMKARNATSAPDSSLPGCLGVSGLVGSGSRAVRKQTDRQKKRRWKAPCSARGGDGSRPLWRRGRRDGGGRGGRDAKKTRGIRRDGFGSFSKKKKNVGHLVLPSLRQK